ncbi:MAG: hypothetical protein ABSF69_05065 [Polyangiaceae bacterium]
MSSRLFSSSALLALCLAFESCTDMTAPPAVAQPLSSYGGHAAELFDDTIEPSAVGFEIGGGGLSAAQALTERTQSADCVVLARVVTVTSLPDPAGRSWQVGLHTLANLAGPRPRSGDFTLSVAASDPAAGILRAVEARLVGVTFVVLLRDFASGSGERGGSATHFHVVRDSREQLDAIHAAAVLGEVR